MSDIETPELKTIGDVERIVHASGVWDGTSAVEFSDDGESWREAWSPTVIDGNDGEPIRVVQAHPEFARVTVYRKDVRVPTKVTIRWDEQVPVENEEWSENWHRSPMRHFGRTARMVGFRQTFRDLLGDIRIPDEDQPPPKPEVIERDWAAEFEAADTPEAIEDLGKWARAARAFTPDAEGTALHRAWRDRRKQLNDAAWRPEARELSSDELDRHHAFFGDPARIAAPQDHRPPQNRAQRRAAGRKKGRR